MKNFKRWISIMLMLCITFSAIPITAQAVTEVANGTCGEKLTWVLTDDGTLTISGEGAMDDYESSSAVPWKGFWTDYREKITKIVINEGVTTIGKYAFNNCRKLTNITIANSVSSIGDYAFYHCSTLTEVTIPNSVASIGDCTFCFCNMLTKVSISCSVTNIGDNVFSFCYNLTEIWVDEKNPVYSSDTYGVLFNKEKTTLIKAPQKISGSYAIADSVITIDDEAFNECELTEVTIPDSVTNIGNQAFSYCTNLTSVSIGNGVTAITNEQFDSCTNLNYLRIGSGVSSINTSTFFDCNNLAGIWIDENNPYYSNDAAGALYNKEKTLLIFVPNALTGEYSIPRTTTTIDSRAFSKCNNLTKVFIPDSISFIGENTFRECSSLIEIYVDKNNIFYSSDASGVLFDKNKNLLISAPGDISGNYTMPESVTSIAEYAFFECDNLIHVNITDGVKSIPDYAFYGCKNLESVIIPKSVTKIGWWSFAYSGVKSITIPKSVTSILRSAFSHCNSLSDIFFKGDAPSFQSVGYNGISGEFEGVYATAYYPANNTTWTYKTKQDYGGDIYWVSYEPEEDAEDTTPENPETSEPEVPETPEPEIPELPAPEYELVLTPNEESLSTKVGQTLEIKCELYCDGIRVDTWEYPQVSISHGEDIAPLTYAGFDALKDGSCILRLKGYTSGTAFVTISESISQTTKTIEIKVSELDENEFIKALYHADSIVYDDEVNFNAMIRYINEYSPSGIIFENSNFNKSFEIWDEITLFYDSLADGDAHAKHEFKQLDVCEAILINALEYATTDKSAETWGLSTVEKTVDITKSLLTTTENIIKIETNAKLDINKEISEMTDKEKSDLKSAFEKSLETSTFKSAVVDLKKSVDFVGEIMEIAKTATDLVKKTTAYLELWHVSDSMIKVLEAMLTKIPDTEEFKYMREATEFCIDMINQSNYEQFVECAILRADFMTGGKYIITEGISYLWDGIKDMACAKSPILATLLIVYKGGKTLFNSIWNLDNTSEHVFKLSVSSNYTGFLKSAILKLKNEYTSSRTIENANALLNSISLLHAFEINECDIACSFAKAVNNSVAEKIAGAINQEGSDAKTVLYEYATSTKREFIFQNIDAATHWVSHLEEDHPEHYDDYKNLIEEDRYQDALIVPITTDYVIKCPVDVCIFDKSGNLVFELNRDGAYTFGDVSAIQIGDKKIVRILNSDEYTISCDGYAEGEMNISIQEYQGTEKTRDAIFYDLAVSEDSAHKINKIVDSTDKSIYTITTEETVINADLDTGIDKCSVHQYGEPRFEWVSANKCYAKFICIDKDDMQTVACSVISETTPATTSEDGYTIYTATVEFNGQTYTDSKTVVIPATDHNLYNLKGFVTSAISDNGDPEIIHIVLYKENTTEPFETLTLTESASYCFSNLFEGNYKIKFVQDGCVTLTYNIVLNDTESEGNINPFLSIIGDADRDGELTASDALCLKKYFVDLFTEDDISVVHSDMNKDGKIDSKDLLAIKVDLSK